METLRGTVNRICGSGSAPSKNAEVDPSAGGALRGPAGQGENTCYTSQQATSVSRAACAVFEECSSCPESAEIGGSSHAAATCWRLPWPKLCTR